MGDLVLGIDPKTKRAAWQLALIDEVLPGRDGLVRKVKIRTAKELMKGP